MWHCPVFEGFFHEVRKINASLPKDRQVRVLLGDPPIDWSKIHSADEYVEACKALTDRDNSPVGIVKHEVIAKQRRALVVYGGMHLLRKSLYWQLQDHEEAARLFKASPNTVVSLLESLGVKVFSIWSTVHADLATVHPDVSSWKIPSLAPIDGTRLGSSSFRSFYPHAAFSVHNGLEERIFVDVVRSPVMQEQFDAFCTWDDHRN